MPTGNKTVTFRHVFDGGWATDFGDTAEVGAGQDGLVRIPFLDEAKNVFFELDGGPHKIGGTAQMNGTAISGANEVVGLYDFWKGAGGTPTQKIVAHSGTLTWQASLDGNFTSFTGSISAGAVPSFETFDDLLIIAWDSSDVPNKWTQSGASSTLSAGAPNFAFSATHKNRLWAAGVSATPSRLFYSAHVDPTDWSGEGSGFIDIDPADGDSIRGIASHKDQLWVFKGPYKGSIHRIVGSAPTGGDSFGLVNFVRGIGAVSHNSIFRFRDDLGFMWSDGSVHSLKATAAFGDMVEASLSRPINSWLRDHITAGSMKKVWAVNDTVRGYVLFTIPINTSTSNNQILMMDYRFDPPRWSHWDSFDSGALAVVSDGGSLRVFDGSSTGFVRRIQRSSRNIDGTGSISADTRTPSLNYGDPMKMKTLNRASLGLRPVGDLPVTLAWGRDNRAEQTQTVTQGGTGTALGSFVLGTSKLGGAQFVDRYMALETGGEFRNITYAFRNAGVNEDLELHSFSASVTFGADSGEN